MREQRARGISKTAAGKAETSPETRTAERDATAVRDVLRALFTLSESQLAALEREDYAGAAQIALRKEDLLPLLSDGVENLRERGWELQNPAGWPHDSPVVGALREASDLARRLQAHERYMLGQMVMRKNRAADRLETILHARHAAAGYHVTASRGATIDTAR